MKQATSRLFKVGICAVVYISATSSATLAQVTSDGTVNTQVNIEKTYNKVKTHS